MGIILDVLDNIDVLVETVGSGAFGTIAGAVIPVFKVSAVFVVVLTGINLMIQTIPMTLGNGISLIVRIGLVAVFLGDYGSFLAVYDVLTDAPARLGGTILSALSQSTVANLYVGLDQLFEQSLNIGDAVSQNGSFFAGALTGVALFILSAIMAVISIIIIGAAKLMLAVLIMIAPLAIAATIFRQTAPFFDAFVKLALGFALVPMLTSAMAGFTIATARTVAPGNADSVTNIGDVVSFVVVMMMGAGLMFMVPTIAQSLAQTSTGLGAAAASTYSQGRNLASRGAAAGAKGGTAAGSFASGAINAMRGKPAPSNADSRSKTVGYSSAALVQRLAGKNSK